MIIADTAPQLMGNFREGTLEDRRALRKEYVLGKGTVKALAEKHGLSHRTVLHWSRDDKWTQLRQKREQMEIGKLSEGLMPEEPRPEAVRSSATILQGHIDRIDGQLETATDAKDVIALSRARESFEKQLHFARHGSWPGTTKPASNRRRQSASPITPTFEPEG